MHVGIKSDFRVDTNQLSEQRDLIGKLVSNLEAGRTGISIKRDLAGLIGIKSILDTLTDSVDRADSVNTGDLADLARQVVEGWDNVSCMEAAEQYLIDFWTSPEGADDYESTLADYVDIGGPECPGCICPGDCNDCEYTNN